MTMMKIPTDLEKRHIGVQHNLVVCISIIVLWGRRRRRLRQRTNSALAADIRKKHKKSDHKMKEAAHHNYSS